MFFPAHLPFIGYIEVSAVHQLNRCRLAHRYSLTKPAANSCTAIAWVQFATQTLGTTAISGAHDILFASLYDPTDSQFHLLAFSALRAYALSSQNRWLASLIMIFALPPSVMTVVSLYIIIQVSIK